MSPVDVISFSVLNAVGGAAVRALVLAAVAWLVLRLFRVGLAAAQHAIWTAVVGGMLLLPLLVPVTPPVWTAPIMRVPSLAASRAPLQAAPGHIQRATPIRMEINDGRLTSVSESVTRSVTWWAAAVLAIYLTGLLAFAARLGIGLFLSGRLIAKATPLRDTEANEMLTNVAQSFALPYPWPALYESASLTAPAVIPGQVLALLLPKGWRKWQGVKLRAVLLHELAHAMRGDCWVMTLAAVNRAVFWFHPLAWWLERRIAELCEEASDDATVSATGDPASYAQVLIQIAADMRTEGGRLMPGALAAPSMAGVSGVARRIHHVLDSETFGAGMIGVRQWFGTAVVTVGIVGMLAAAQTTEQSRVISGDVPASWQFFQEGFRVNAEQARELEAQIARQPEDLSARARLLAYYYYNMKVDDFVRHAQWVIEHHPESQLAASELVLGAQWSVGFMDPSKADAVQKAMQQLWREQAERHISDARVVGNAGRALKHADPAESERLLLRASQIDPGNAVWRRSLAELYADAIRADFYAAAGLTMFPWARVASTGFADHARAALATSTESELVGLTGAELARFVVNMHESVKDREPQLAEARQQVADAAKSLLLRANAVQPGREEWLRAVDDLDRGTWKQPLQMAAPVKPAPTMRAVTPVEAPEPEYPALARQARIQGVVRFHVRVDGQGQVANITVLNGHPLLVPAAMQSVRRYTYQPTGAEFETTADVNFALPR